MEQSNILQLYEYIKVNGKVILWIPLNLEKNKVKKVLKNNLQTNFKNIKFVNWYDQEDSILFQDFTKLNSITENILFIINDLKSYLTYKPEIKDSKNYFIILCDFNTSILDLKEIKEVPNIWFSIGEMDIKVNLDLIKHKPHNYEKKFNEKKDNVMYYNNFEGHRNIMKEIDIKKYKRHYVQIHQQDLDTFVGLYEKSSKDPP